MVSPLSGFVFAEKLAAFVLELRNGLFMFSSRSTDFANPNDLSADVLHMTTSLLASDLKTDRVQEFSEKIKQFDVVNKEIFETIANIRTLKSTLVDEVNRRTQLKNIY